MLREQVRIEAFWSLIDRRDPDECWPWTGCSNNTGYGSFRVGGKVEGTHRISWFLADGLIPVLFEGLPSQICHSCDNPPCCNPAHLFFGNDKINSQDSVAKDRRAGSRVHSKFFPKLEYRGEGNPNVRLTKEIVVRIRELYGRGVFTQEELGNMFGVKQVAISRIIRRVTWDYIG